MGAPVIPKAIKKNKNLSLHGDTRIDPWYWLNNWDDPKVKNHLHAENLYAKNCLEPTKALQTKIFSELKGRINVLDRSVPMQDGQYWYFSQISKDQDYPVFARTQGHEKAKPEILLDINLLAKQLSYCDLGACTNSPDHRYLAYSIDTTGEEDFTIYVKDLKTGKNLGEKITGASDCLEWTQDSASFFYCTLDHLHRPNRVYQHKLGEDPKKDRLIYEEEDQRFFVSLDKSESERFIYICVDGNNMSECYYLDASGIPDQAKLIEQRQKEHEYEVSDHEDFFLIRTNLNALDFRIVKTPIDKPSSNHWEDLIPHRPCRLLESFSVYQDFLVVQERAKGQPEIFFYSFSNQETEYIRFNDEAFDLSLLGHRNFSGSLLRYSYQSPKTPPSIFDFDMKTKTQELKKKYSLPDPGFDENNYSVKRLYTESKDGVSIPMSVVYRHDTELIERPTLICAYGSYGVTTDAEFNSQHISLLDRGFLLVLAHIRGGMDLGHQWYLDGKLLKKQNTFLDFISCCEYLQKERLSDSKRFVAMGGSAGGLLMGAVMNSRPDLFTAVVAQVPFVDTLTTMLDPTLPLTTSEYNEWGDPREREYYEYIKSYSPYDNVSAQEYPYILVTTGLSDTRVSYWEPAKWVLKLREKSTSGKKIILNINLEAGHGGASARYDYLKEIASELAFVVYVCQNDL